MKRAKFFGFVVGATFLVLPFFAMANTNDDLTVYVQVNGTGGNCNGNNNTYYNNNNNNYNSSCYNSNNYDPSNFRISISGANASPASFQGSQYGTRISLSSDYYSVNPDSQSGWTYNLSGDCSGNASNNQSRSCTVTYTPTNNNNQYCQNNNNYNNCYSNQYSNQGVLTCWPNSQQVALGSTAVLNASGGTGSYIWSSGGYTYSGNGATLNAQFYSAGPQTVMVTSDGQTAYCTVTVIGNGYNTGYNYNQYLPPNTPYVTQTPYTTTSYYPHVPNTGYAPITIWQMLLAAILLVGFGYLAYHVRNKGLYISR